MAVISLKWAIFAWFYLATNILGMHTILGSNSNVSLNSNNSLSDHTFGSPLAEATFPLNEIENSDSMKIYTSYESDALADVSHDSSNDTTIWLMDGVADKKRKTFRCIKCTTQKNGKGCMDIKDPIFMPNCGTEIGQCYTSIIKGVVHRGCVGDDLFPDQPSTGNPDYLTHVCNNNRFCNQEKITDTCIICNGDADECKKPTLATEKTCSFEQKGIGCFLRKSSQGTYERGCLRDLTDNERIECNRLGSDHCQSCYGRNCNIKSELTQECYYCNGTRDKNCFETVDKELTIMCISYNNRCLVGVDENGYAHRQCSSSTVENDLARFENGYELCNDNLCNTQIFPKDWKKCFKCSSAEDTGCDHPSASMVPQNCRTLNDQCYIYGIEGILVILVQLNLHRF